MQSFFGHPRGLATLFFTELWERFSYYGMRAILILFMVASAAHGGLGFSDAKAGAIYGLYTSLVYLLSLPGGWIADRLLGPRYAVLCGGITIALGHFAMAVPAVTMFYFGSLLIVLGTGLLKPNVSIMVGQLYGDHDPRRDAGFSIFYMGINIGALISPLICGYLGQKVNWHYGFGAAGVGMTFGIIQYVLGWKHLGNAGLPPVTDLQTKRRIASRVLMAALAFAVLIGLSVAGILPFTVEGVADSFGIVLMVIVVAVFALLLFAVKWTRVERNRIVAIFVLFIAAALFWAAYEQAGSTLNLFADRNTRLVVFGYAFPSSWFQSMNSMFVMPLAPLFAWLWVRLGKNNPSSTLKFSLGLIFVGLGFAVLLPVSRGTNVSPWWLFLTYLLHTMGELCLSPVGLSAMTKLAPARVASFIMGVWFLATSVGDYISGQLASFYKPEFLPALFGWVAAVTVVAGLLLLLLVRPMHRLTAGAD